MSTKTEYLEIPITNPSPTRGDMVKYAYKIHSKHLLHNTSIRPMFLLMGMTMTQVEWYDFVDKLSINRCVITCDHRGIGLSKIYYNNKPIDSRQSVDFTLHDLATDAFMLITYLFGFKPVKLCMVGFSMGGRTAQYFSIKYPQYLSDLFLLATSPKQKSYFDPKNATRMENRSMTARQNVLSLTANSAKNWDPYTLDKYSQLFQMQNRPTNIVIAQKKAIEKYDMMKHLDTLNNYSRIYKFNIHILHGDADGLLSLEDHGMVLKQALLNSKLYILPGEGHAIFWTKTGLNACLAIIDKATAVKQSQL
eukprot:499070_1